MGTIDHQDKMREIEDMVFTIMVIVLCMIIAIAIINAGLSPF
ncbi:MAG TPA: hypothetical protein PLO06_05175 [Methanoregulaceae archaeon]|nr:hypothetical protein [Methanoregulaceae archaeon]HPD76529.1 hypothetical protein [Methanoregulaceae archaeon]